MCLITSTLGIDWFSQLDPVKAECPYWQYGIADHHSTRSILGSVVLLAFKSDGTQMLIRHLVLDGSSQLVVCRNVTSRTDIPQIDGCCLRTEGATGSPVSLPLLDRNHHLYFPLSLFRQHKSVRGITVTTGARALDCTVLR